MTHTGPARLPLCHARHAHLQIAAKIPEIYEVQLPTATARLLSSFELGISLGISNVATPLACLGANGHSSKLLFWFLSPLVATGLAILFYVGRLAARESPVLGRVRTLMRPVTGPPPPPGESGISR